LNPEIEAHLRSLVSFPSPPGVASHIIELARDPEIEMGKVAKVLSLDSALASKVLRIANSPLYAQRRKSENLRQALVVLGLNATLTLALSFSLVKSLRAGKANGVSFPFYWRRALLAATAARALADAMHHPMADARGRRQLRLPQPFHQEVDGGAASGCVQVDLRRCRAAATRRKHRLWAANPLQFSVQHTKRPPRDFKYRKANTRRTGVDG